MNSKLLGRKTKIARDPKVVTGNWKLMSTGWAQRPRGLCSQMWSTHKHV